MKGLITTVFVILMYVAQGQFAVYGTVSNQEGEQLEGAVVYLEDTDFAVATDTKGKFRFEGVQEGTYYLVASYLGYENYRELIEVDVNLQFDIQVGGQLYKLEAVEILSDRVGARDPFSYQNQSAKDLESRNVGQDIPFLLNHTPSTVVTSDAGTGIGYTSLRIRGSDQTRINVTINGVPLNDAESHNVFWVDLPDLASSVNDIQIQRGVGPSTNGPGAYGGTVSINTHDVDINPFVELDGTLGSFGTRKVSAKVGTGLLNNKFAIEGRYSAITSDGYIDRATADLSSYYIGISRVTSKSSLRFITFSGQEKTYQAWYGTPESRVEGDLPALQAHYDRNVGSIYNTTTDSLNLFNSDRRYNYYTYPNQVDNYRQSHYQLHYAIKNSEKIHSNYALFSTLGDGYFEEYRYQDDLANYNLNPYIDMDGNMVFTDNLVRRRWLDNTLIGGLFNVVYDASNRHTLTWGGMINRYVGDHFGEVILTENPVALDLGSTYYDNQGVKSDISTFLRSEALIGSNFQLYTDVQFRNVGYRIEGDDNDGVVIDIKDKYNFLNPKIGMTYFNENGEAYLSLALAQKEPNRSDFIDNQLSGLPKSEALRNVEFGYKYKHMNNSWSANVYYMNYKDQLIPTGDVNDVGALIRTNVDQSYRLGLEIAGLCHLVGDLWWDGDFTISRNKISKFDEVIFDYLNNERIVINHTNTDIAFSPNIIGRSQFTYNFIRDLSLAIESKYVGQQFLDNTQNTGRSLDAYLVNNARLSYTMKTNRFIKEVVATLHANNILNTMYSANGYTYTYLFGDSITENFLYPQAGIQIMAGLRLRW